MSSGYFEAMKSAFPPKEEKEPLNEQRLKMTNTIEKLMEGKTPGSITIIHTGGAVFTPYFMDEEERWVGKDLNGWRTNYSTDSSNWAIYEEPKKLTKRWLWAFKEPGCTFYNISLTLMTEEEAADNFDHEDSYYKYGTGIEVKE